MGGYFLRVYYHQMIARMLIDNNFVYRKRKRQRRGGREREKVKLPKVYMKREKYETIVTLPTDGNKFHDHFLKLGKKLEEMFNADLISEDREFGFVNYRFLTDVIGNRISIDECVTKNGSIQLMKGLSWCYESVAHMLIVGGTGGGKTYLLYSLIKACLSVGTVDICDPKNADLSHLSQIDVFKGHVFYGEMERMIKCLERARKEMDDRFVYMKSLPNYEMGKSYAHFNLPPHFLFFDEWAAFYGSLDRKEQERVNIAVHQIVLKGRQAGVFFIPALQRADAEYFPSGVRDNLEFRVSVGRLSETGYHMAFGQENKNKPFFNKKIKGRGYCLNSSGMPREFYAPFVPNTYNFFEEFKKFKKMIVLDMTPKEQEVVPV